MPHQFHSPWFDFFANYEAPHNVIFLVLPLFPLCWIWMPLLLPSSQKIFFNVPYFGQEPKFHIHVSSYVNQLSTNTLAYLPMVSQSRFMHGNSFELISWHSHPLSVLIPPQMLKSKFVEKCKGQWYACPVGWSRAIVVTWIGEVCPIEKFLEGRIFVTMSWSNSWSLMIIIINKWGSKWGSVYGRADGGSEMSALFQICTTVHAGSNSSCGAVTCCQGCQSRASLQVQPSSNDEELMTLRSEIRRLQTELGNANARLQESEEQLKER